MATVTNEQRVRWMRSFAGKLAKEERTQKTAQRIFDAAEALELANVGLSHDAAAEVGSRRIARLLSPGTRVRMHLVSERKQLVEIVAVSRYEVVARIVTAGSRAYGSVVIIPKHAVLFYELLDGVEDGNGKEE